MRKFVFLVLLMSSYCTFSQNSDIEKITFNYSIGGSSWGQNRIFSRSEIFELIKDKNGDFLFNKLLKIKNKVRNQKITKDTIAIKKESQSTISKNEIENLVNELNTNRENFIEDFLRKNFTKPTKKEILKIAKKNNEKDLFVNDYEEKYEIENKYSDIQNFKYLSEFLTINQAKINSTFTTFDAWNILIIIIYKKDEVKMYDLRFFESYGQPISIHNIKIVDEKTNNFEIIGNTEKQIINLNVNQVLQKILPQKSMTSNIIDLDNIKNEYIIWHLKNHQ
jgi:hypothetical protein